MPFINKPDSSRDLTILISFISSLEIINVYVCEAKSEGRPDPNIFLCIAVSVTDAAAVNANGIKTLLASGLSRSLSKSS